MDEKCIIGITGGIGAGKSVVSRILRLKGYPVYDCDYEAKRLMDNNEDVIFLLKELLSEEIYTEEGKLDRRLMSQKLFSDDEIRLGVNKIVHEAVRNDFLVWADQFGSPVFVESAILSTSLMDRFCTNVWLIDAPVGMRVERVKKRNGLTEEEILARITSQAREVDLLPKTKTETIDNSGEVPLLDQIDKLLELSNQI